MARTFQTTAARYGIAVLAAALALALRLLLTPLVGATDLAFTIFLPAILFAAWVGGFWAGAVSVAVSAVAADYFFAEPVRSFGLRSRRDQISLLIFVVLGLGMAWLADSRKRAVEARRESERQLALQLADVEKRVKERTAELEQSNQALRQLSVRVLRVQDEEGRRIARELHDSAGQYLAAVAMALDAVRNEAHDLPLPFLRQVEEAAELTKTCSAEIRTISHLLHPPLLEELGLASAVRWYVEGFAARSGVRVELEIPKELNRLGNDVELVLFRLLQESLTNVHRHSGSKTAIIRIGADSRQAWLEIQDQGKGTGDGNGKVSSEPFRAGIGITGMRERVKELAGVLEITSTQNGTRVKAVIPLAVIPLQVKVDQTFSATTSTRK